jgi:hypothetical protein
MSTRTRRTWQKRHLVTMRHVSIYTTLLSPCLGQTWQCAVRERPARRAAAPPLLLFWLRGAQWSGRCRVERRGTRREQRESDGVQYVVVATRAMRVWRPPATRDASALGANVEDQRFAGVVMDVPRTMTEAAAAVSP